MGAYIGIDTGQELEHREVGEMYLCEGSSSPVYREVEKAYLDVDGVWREVFSGGVPLKTFPEGTIIYLPENGVPTAYMVVKHNYESGLNGPGRTLVTTMEYWKDEMIQYHTSSSMTGFAGTNAFAYLNGAWKTRFSPGVQALIGTTKYYLKDNVVETSYTSSPYESAIFLFSMTELNLEYSNTKKKHAVEGTALPESIIQQLLPVYNVTERPEFLVRTIMNAYTASIANVWGTVYDNTITNNYYTRAVFTLPESAKFYSNYHLIA